MRGDAHAEEHALKKETPIYDFFSVGVYIREQSKNPNKIFSKKKEGVKGFE